MGVAEGCCGKRQVVDRSRSKREAGRQLHLPRRPGGDSTTEQRGGDRADKGALVHPVRDVERIDGERDRWCVLLLSDREIPGEPQVKLRVRRTDERVARDSNWSCSSTPVVERIRP